MKKIVSMLLAAVMLCCFAATAFADYDEILQYADTPRTANLSVRCDSESAYTFWNKMIFKSGQYGSYDNHAIYVRHYVDGGSTAYTNSIRAHQVNGSTLSSRGSKWCEVGKNIPIQNNNITLQNFYTISARGNTNHYMYDGVSSMMITANCYVNFKQYP